MIKILLILLCSCYTLYGAMNDALATFSTKGIDRYLDGSMVIDGEVYALTWTINGEKFHGFNDDGSLVSSNDKLLLLAPLAKNGSCPQTLFQIDYYVAEQLMPTGYFEVYLLDTRIKAKDGTIKLASLKGGKPSSINAFVKVGESTILSAACPAPIKLVENSKNGAIVSSLSVMTKPKITSIHVCDGIIELGIDNLSPIATTRLFCGDDYRNCSTYLSIVNTNLIKIKQKTNKQFFMLKSERNF